MEEALIRRAELELLRLRGVSSIAIDHAGGEIDAIHITTGEDRHPKQIVRDVVSTLRSLLKISVDHKKVSVARMASDRSAAGSADFPRGEPRRRREGDRVALESITVRDSGREREAEVVVTCNGRQARGLARGGIGATRTARLMAQATVRALERFVDSRYRLDIEDVRYVSLSAREAILVTASVVDDRYEKVLLGCGWVTDDPPRAAVRATLDALNRVFGRLDRRRHVEYEVGPTSSDTEVFSEANDTAKS